MTMTPAQRIKAARVSKNMTQAELALRARVDTRSVRRLEDGVRVSINTLASVCAELNIDSANLNPEPVPVEKEASDVPQDILTQEHAVLCQDVLRNRKNEQYGKESFVEGMLCILPGSLVSLASVLVCGAFASNKFHTFLMAQGSGKTDDALRMIMIVMIVVILYLSFIGLVQSLGGRLELPLSRNPLVSRVRKLIWVVCPLIMPAGWALACVWKDSFPLFLTGILLGTFAPIVVKMYMEFLGDKDVRKEYQEAQETLETLLTAPLDSEAAILALAETAREKMTSLSYPQSACFLAPLVWLGQDLQLGLATVGTASLYTSLASEYAQDTTKSPRYKDIVEAHKTPVSLLYSIDQRFEALKKKAEEQLEHQYA